MMRRAIVAAVCVAALALCCPLAAVAGPHGARLDPGYGHGGVARTAFGVAGEEADVELTAIPGGSALVADGLEGTAVRFGAGGSQDRRFGDAGRLVVAQRSKLGGAGKHFFPDSITADRRGRVLIFGYQTDSSKTAEGAERVIVSAALAAVLRFTAAGRPDRTFGEGSGYVIGDFGMPLGEKTGLTSASALSGRVDSEGRPLFVAASAGPVGGCLGHGGIGTVPRALVRLTESGQADPTFGAGDGISPFEGSGSFPFLGLDAADQPAVGVGRVGSFAAACGEGTTVYRFGSAGEPLAGFGPAGAVEFSSVHLGLVERSGALLLSERIGRVLKLVETGPEGSPDPAFGTAGVAKLPLPVKVGLHLSPAGVDSKGRILLAGFVGSPISEPAKGQPKQSSFVVARLHPDGELDRSFGKNGWIFSPLPDPLELTSTQATVDSKGRLLVAGTVTKPHHLDGAFAVARYLLGR